MIFVILILITMLNSMLMTQMHLCIAPGSMASLVLSHPYRLQSAGCGQTPLGHLCLCAWCGFVVRRMTRYWVLKIQSSYRPTLFTNTPPERWQPLAPEPVQQIRPKPYHFSGLRGINSPVSVNYLPRDAMLCYGLCCRQVSVRLFVCLSVIDP